MVMCVREEKMASERKRQRKKEAEETYKVEVAPGVTVGSF